MSKYEHPAKIHCLAWKDTLSPPSPYDIEVEKNELGVTLKWQYPSADSVAERPAQFIIYCSQKMPLDISNSDHILAILSQDIYQYFDEHGSEQVSGRYYTVTALDAAENESPIKEVVYIE